MLDFWNDRDFSIMFALMWSPVVLVIILGAWQSGETTGSLECDAKSEKIYERKRIEPNKY